MTEDMKAKYAAINAAKAAAKAAKKAKYAEVNADRNMPVCEIIIPERWVDEPSNSPIAGKEIDLDHPSTRHWVESLEWLWRWPRSIRTAST
jgi:hypothetical protein